MVFTRGKSKPEAGLYELMQYSNLKMKLLMDVTTDNWTFGNTALFTLNDLWSNIQKSGSLYTEHTCMNVHM